MNESCKNKASGTTIVKACTKCGEPAFTKHSWCRACLCQRTTEYYQTEEGRAKKREWRRSEKARQYQNRYNSTPKAIASREAYRKSEKGKPVIKAIYTIQNHKRRARLAGGDVTPKEVRSLLEKSKYCGYCGVRFTSKMTKTIDHVQPLSKGGDHALKNLRVCCQKCNSSKNDKTPEDWASKIGMLFL